MGYKIYPCDNRYLYNLHILLLQLFLFNLIYHLFIYLFVFTKILKKKTMKLYLRLFFSLYPCVYANILHSSFYSCCHERLHLLALNSFFMFFLTSFQLFHERKFERGFICQITIDSRTDSEARSSVILFVLLFVCCHPFVFCY